jgi:hypothetical protein
MEEGKKEERSWSSPYATESTVINQGQGKLVLRMRIRNRWMRGTMLDI